MPARSASHLAISWSLVNWMRSSTQNCHPVAHYCCLVVCQSADSFQFWFLSIYLTALHRPWIHHLIASCQKQIKEAKFLLDKREHVNPHFLKLPGYAFLLEQRVNGGWLFFALVFFHDTLYFRRIVAILYVGISIYLHHLGTAWPKENSSHGCL